MKNQNTPIVFITDDGYVTPTVVAIESIIKNSKSENLSIKVVYSNLTEENKRYILNCATDINHIDLIQFNIGEYRQFENKSLYVTPTALIKFELANIFKSYEKILYIDGDIIVRKDIDVLFDVNIENCYAAVVKDIESSISELSAQRLKLKDYFNSGVMLLNLKKIRQDNLPTKMFEIKKSRMDLYYMDQDVLNLVFNNKVKFLPVKYNFIKNSFLNNNFDIRFTNEFFSSDYKSLNELEDDAIIVHLAGAKKPWKIIDAICSKEWLEYYRQSPIGNKELILLPNKQNRGYRGIIKRILKRKSTINSKGEYEIKIYLLGLPILSKIRGAREMEYKIFGCLGKKYKYNNEG